MNDDDAMPNLKSRKKEKGPSITSSSFKQNFTYDLMELGTVDMVASGSVVISAW